MGVRPLVLASTVLASLLVAVAPTATAACVTSDSICVEVDEPSPTWCAEFCVYVLSGEHRDDLLCVEVGVHDPWHCVPIQP